MGRPTDKSGNEAYLKGRKEGVSDTYGTARKGVAEKTAPKPDHGCDGGAEPELSGKAASIYSKAVKNADHNGPGDKALTER